MSTSDQFSLFPGSSLVSDPSAMKVAALFVSPGHNYFGHHGRPAGTHPIESVASVECVAGRGLRGDRFWDYKPDNPGQITFFAEEVHRALLAGLHPAPRSPSAYRRNVITRGVSLNELIGREFTVQGVTFLGMSESKPCYWMNEAVAPGAEGFLRGRGGLRAQILTDGELHVDCPSPAGLLLAGGRSQRMGRDKAGLDWHGRPLGEHQAATLAASGAWPLYLSCRADQPWTPTSFTRLEDQTDAGALGALTTALATTTTPVTTVLAIDLPFVSAALLASFADRAREEAISVVALHNGCFEPLAAAWHRSALPALQAALTAGASLQSVCATLQAEGRLRPQLLSAAEGAQFANLNTPDDLARAT